MRIRGGPKGTEWGRVTQRQLMSDGMTWIDGRGFSSSALLPMAPNPIRVARSAWLRMAALVSSVFFIGCGPQSDTEIEDTCQYCISNSWASVDCTFKVTGQLAHVQRITCSASTDGASLAAACDSACAVYTAEDNGKTCLDVVGAPEVFLCDGTSYATEGLPSYDSSGADGADGTTASDPVWEPSKYVTYNQSLNLYIVDADFVDALKLDPALLVLDGVDLTYQTTGGFQFGGITTGSLMDLLGLQNGDTPLAVNGHDVSTIDGVLVARAAVDDATALTVVVSRSGSPITLDYLIR